MRNYRRLYFQFIFAFTFFGCWFTAAGVWAQSVQWQSLASDLNIAVSNPQRSRRSPDATVYVDISNNGTGTITGNVRLLVSNLQPASVSITGLQSTADGAVLDLSSMLGDGLAPGESLPRISLVVAGGGSTTFTFDVDVQQSVLVDIGPSVHIVSPTSLATLGSSPVTVAGTVQPEAAVLTVNGMEVPHSDGNFSVDVALQEGHNTVVARAVLNGQQVTDSISLSLDMTPPYITLDSHQDGDKVFTDKVTVTGLINDIVRGTIEAEQASVNVNGVAATISNRSYAAENVPLQEGANTIVVNAVDQVGNAASLSFVLHYQVPGQRKLQVLSGQSQQAIIGEILADPLQVVVLENDTPVAEAPVVFRVIQGSGAVDAGAESEGRAVVVETDSAGIARTNFRLGARVGTANHKVKAAVVGYESEVIFNASAGGRTGNKISVNSGNNQRGTVGQVLPEALVVVVTDSGANVVKGARVKFEVTVGGGTFNDGSSVREAQTDSDGRAAVELMLGALEGLDAQRVTATLIDAPEGQIITAGFTATAFVPADPGLTTISGVVLDNQDVPVAGVTIRVDGTTRQAVADTAGRFLIEQAPVGPVHLIADGSTATAEGEYPSLSYNIVTVAGVDNPLPAPVYMVKLNTENSVYAGPADVALELAKYPGFKLEIAKDSVTFPDGSREGYVSVTPVNSSRVPMTPPNGMQPQFIVTIQPTNTLFDPPARLTLPNVDGHTPGAQVEMYSFDHDLEEFVAIGLGTVSEDGTVVTSNPGVGIIKAGWHCGSQPGGQGCAHNCPICRDCDGNCNCVPVGGDPRLASMEQPGDCKKPECQGGSPVMVDDDADVPNTQDVKGDCKKPGCESGTPTDVNDDTDISEEDAKCKTCSNGSVTNDATKNGNKCGDGSPEQDCLICKDGSCTQPDCDAAGEQVSLSVGTEIDPKSVPGLGKLVSAAEKALTILPVQCDVPKVNIKGSYKTGEDCCQDCSKKDKGQYHQVSGSGEITSDCVIGKKTPDLNIDWPIVAFGWGIQVEIIGKAVVGVTFKPAFSLEVSGKYNFTCEEGCVAGEGKLGMPVFGGVSAEIRKAEAEVKFGSFGDWDVVEINGPKIEGGLSIGTVSGSVSGGFGAAAGCDSLNCKLTLGDGKFLFTFMGGTIQLFDVERLTINLSEYINWELEVPLWSGGELSCR